MMFMAKPIQGLYGHADSEGCFYALLARVTLARFSERKRRRPRKLRLLHRENEVQSHVESVGN